MLLARELAQVAAAADAPVAPGAAQREGRPSAELSQRISWERCAAAQAAALAAAGLAAGALSAKGNIVENGGHGHGAGGLRAAVRRAAAELALGILTCPGTGDAKGISHAAAKQACRPPFGHAPGAACSGAEQAACRLTATPSRAAPGSCSKADMRTHSARTPHALRR